MARWIRIALMALGLLSMSRPVRAAGPYDPDVHYRALSTPNFYVVHPVGYEHIALRAGQIAEDLYPGMCARFGYTPRGRTTIIINDQNDFANGSATVLPNKVITIYVTAPTEVSGLEDYEDWLKTVIDHEMAHIIHLDMVFGLPVLGRWIFGKYVALNQYTPAWVSEGLAVYEETYSSATGRGRSSYVEMVLRMAALDDEFPSIDEAYRSYSFWPFANVAYMFGGRFQQWLAERYGEDALMRYHRIYAETPIPYFTWWASEMAFNYTLEELWMAFERETIEDAKLTAQLVRSSSLAETRAERLTHYGGNVLGPRITPDGRHIVFSTSSPKDGPRVRRITIDGKNDEPLINDTLSKAISFSSEGDAFYYQQTEINQRYYAHNNLYRYDFGEDESEMVELAHGESEDFLAPSGSLRARDPDISPDGRSMVFVQTPYGANRLVLARLSPNGLRIAPKVIIPAEPDVQLSNPRFSPDGEKIAVSRFKGGRRDIMLYDRKGQLIRQVTADRAQDVDPSWTPDGRWLVFSSDRSGIYNLYAYELATDELRQITNLISGAYQPSISPDQETLVFRGYSVEGFDVYKMPFDPEHGLRVNLDRQPIVPLDATPRRWPPVAEGVPPPPPPAPFKDVPVPTNEELPEDWSLEDYSAASTVLPFHDNWNLLPEINADESEVFLQLTHIGRDSMNTHTYALWVTYRTSTQFVGGGATYINDQLEPTFSISANADTRLFRLRDSAGETLDDYVELRLVGSLGMSLPFLRRHLISFGYIFENRGLFNELSEDTIARATGFPATGNFARIRLGYSYSNVRSFAHSISPERGYQLSFALSGLAKGLGSDYQQVVAGTEARGYLSMPAGGFFANHVLASSLSMSAGWGPDQVELFRLGGVGGQSALTTTTQNFFGLRGMPSSILTGTAVLSGSVEYRAPIWRVERGLGTLPFALRVFHAAIFSDFGRVFESLDGDAFTDNFFGEFAVSAGGELRADVLLGYILELQFRVGYAYLLHGPDSENASVVDGSGPFFQIGSLF